MMMMMMMIIIIDAILIRGRIEEGLQKSKYMLYEPLFLSEMSPERLGNDMNHRIVNDRGLDF